MSRIFLRPVAVSLALVCAASLLVSSPVRADQRDFPFTYEWRQERKGSLEFELKTSYFGAEDAFKQEFELEYVVTNRLVVAPYIIAEKNSDHSYDYQGFKLESRYQLNPRFRNNRFLTSVYLEYANERGEDPELEGKFIATRYGNDGSNLSLNLIHERGLSGTREHESAFSLGYARPLNGKGLRVGAETIYNFDEKTVQLGPTFSFAAGQNFYFVGGAVFPLNKRDESGTDLRFNVQYEF